MLLRMFLVVFSGMYPTDSPTLTPTAAVTAYPNPVWGICPQRDHSGGGVGRNDNVELSDTGDNSGAWPAYNA